MLLELDDQLGQVGDEGAGHDELAVRHVDHPHLAEGEGEPERCEQQQRAQRGAVQKRRYECIHVLSLSLRW